MTVASLDARKTINPENLSATTVTSVSEMRAVPELRDGASGSEARNNVKKKRDSQTGTPTLENANANLREN